jgi:hypothetical protein
VLKSRGEKLHRLDFFKRLFKQLAEDGTLDKDEVKEHLHEIDQVYKQINKNLSIPESQVTAKLYQDDHGPEEKRAFAARCHALWHWTNIEYVIGYQYLHHLRNARYLISAGKLRRDLPPFPQSWKTVSESMLQFDEQINQPENDTDVELQKELESRWRLEMAEEEEQERHESELDAAADDSDLENTVDEA